jgi:GDP-L-fucose synthase
MNKYFDSILLTGATGFLGKQVFNELIKRGYRRIVSVGNKGVFSSEQLNGDFRRVDLRDDQAVNQLFRFAPHQIPNLKGVINLAATVGGIGANQKRPADFMMDSLRIGINLIDASVHNRNMQSGGKFVQIGTVCAYPKFAHIPFKEDDLWNGYPEETNAPYGIAKKTLMELVRTYNIQYPNKFRGINLIPVNLYGPGDNFNLETSHVIPALIRKFDTAKLNNEDSVTLWGTGEASREFLYVEDAAEGIVDAFEKYQENYPVNLGTGKEIKIIDLAEHIANLIEYDGTIFFDSSKPDGQPRRCLDVSRAQQKFGFVAKTPFFEGLVKTVRWYQENREWLTQ